MADLTKTRIDKWLWAIRVFKTRSLASDACKAGRVKIDGKSVKASRTVQIGLTISVQKGEEKKVLKVKQIIEKRVGAPIAVTCYEDLSPPPLPRPKDGLPSVFYNYRNMPTERRDKGLGRPTKRDRRTLDKFKTKEEEEE